MSELVFDFILAQFDYLLAQQSAHTVIYSVGIRLLWVVCARQFVSFSLHRMRIRTSHIVHTVAQLTSCDIFDHLQLFMLQSKQWHSVYAIHAAAVAAAASAAP